MRITDWRDQDDLDAALPYIIGAAGGAVLAAAWLLRGRAAEAVRSAGQRLRPGRLRRGPAEEGALRRLEDVVLERLLEDPVLSERGIDVGAISTGIIELSGEVRTRVEAQQAVHLVEGEAGVQTVLNRLEIAEERPVPRPAAPYRSAQGRNVGMGRTRQGGQTEPPRRDDSQWLEERALREADRDEWLEEAFGGEEGPGAVGAQGTGTRVPEGERDNQDPHHAGLAARADAPQQRFNTAARVGEGLKPGTALDLEHADVPVKPHGRQGRNGETEGG
jgi:hypothetical protein